MMNDDVFVPNIKVTGRYPTLTRIKTGLFSLDSAVSYKGNLGLPLQVLIELYGYTNSGKSTLAYYLAGKVASELEKSKIAIADLEFADTEGYIPRAVGMGGFEGEVKMMDITDEKDKPIPHPKILMKLVKSLYFDDKVGAIIWDSIGATQSAVQFNELFSPKGEEFGQAFMGKKPFMVGQVADAISSALQSKVATAIALNHVHQSIGGRGHTTPGGERKGFLAGVRLMIWKGEAFRENDEDDTSPYIGFHVNGQVEKLRFGGPGRKFQYYIVPGFGVHVGVSAMFDAFVITDKLNKLKKKGKISKDVAAYMTAERTARVKLDGKNMGFLKKDLLSYAAQGKRRKFYPFQEIMDRFTEDVERGLIDIKDMEGDADVSDGEAEYETAED
jgi:RecA/RadA recombinase